MILYQTDRFYGIRFPADVGLLVTDRKTGKSTYYQQGESADEILDELGAAEGLLGDVGIDWLCKELVSEEETE